MKTLLITIILSILTTQCANFSYFEKGKSFQGITLGTKINSKENKDKFKPANTYKTYYKAIDPKLLKIKYNGTTITLKNLSLIVVDDIIVDIEAEVAHKDRNLLYNYLIRHYTPTKKPDTHSPYLFQEQKDGYQLLISFTQNRFAEPKSWVANFTYAPVLAEDTEK